MLQKNGSKSLKPHKPDPCHKSIIIAAGTFLSQNVNSVVYIGVTDFISSQSMKVQAYFKHYKNMELSPAEKF